MFNQNFPSSPRIVPPSVEVITTSKVWVPPSGVIGKPVKLTLIGGGQSSGTSTGAPGAGGDGATTAIKTFTPISGASYQIIIGAGGVAGGAATSVGPVNGGNSLFIGGGLSICAYGGGVGASASGGDIAIPSGKAMCHFINGGNTNYGGGASYLSPASASNTPPSGYGAGAGGPVQNAAGINGANGVAILEY